MLRDTRVRQAKAKGSPYKLADSQGLYLYVSDTGTKSWRYDYRFAGKRYTVTHGRYPECTIIAARERHQAARKALDTGQNPSQLKRQERQASLAMSGDTFRANAEVWFAGKSPDRSKSWRDNIRRWLDRDIYPSIGDRSMRDIRAADLLAVLKRMEQDGKAKSAEYVRQVIVQVYDYAVTNLRADSNLARSLRGAISIPEPKVRAPLSAKEIPAFLDAVDAYPGRLATKLATKLLLLNFVRKVELTAAKWEEIDFEKAEWRIPAERMKMKDPHIVPLSKQVLECFRTLEPLAGTSKYVFPNLGRQDKPMNAGTINVVFERIGYQGKFTPHGFRATASTILNEQGWRADVIERQLAHTERNRVRAAYNKAEYLDERRAMMQSWADYIDALCAGGNVTNIRRVA